MISKMLQIEIIQPLKMKDVGANKIKTSVSTNVAYQVRRLRAIGYSVLVINYLVLTTKCKETKHCIHSKHNKQTQNVEISTQN